MGIPSVEYLKGYNIKYKVHSFYSKDGYLLFIIHLIPQTPINKSLLFMHGLFGTPANWYVESTGISMPFEFLENGYDVYLGYTRCNFDLQDYRLHKTYKNTDKRIWDFSIDDYTLDIQEFCKFIKCRHKNPLYGFGHSTGASTLLMYTIQCNIQNKTCLLDKLILIGLAGIHQKYLQTTLPLIDSLIKSHKDLSAFPYTSDTSYMMTFKTLISLPGVSDIARNIIKILFGFDGDIVNCPFGGTSVKVIKHYYQLLKSKKFQMYDYGKEKNLEIYKTETPTLYTDYYSKINIPIYLITGSKDILVDNKDIKKHLSFFKNNPNMKHVYWENYIKKGHTELIMKLSNRDFYNLFKFVKK